MGEFIHPVRVYYEDTDHGGVVYYANYLKFMERARTEWLRALGFEQDALINNDNLIFAVRSVQVDYLKPAHFNDALEASAKVVRRGRAGIDFEQEVRRDGEVLCRGLVKLAALHADTLRPRPLPDALQRRLEESA